MLSLKEKVQENMLEEYERQIISILLSAKYSTQKNILSTLEHKMFYTHLCSKIFKTCSAMFEKEEINIFTIRAKLPKECDEILYLTECYLTSISPQFYIKELQKRYYNNLVTGAKTVEDIKLIQSVMQKYTDLSDFVPISHNAMKLIEDYRNMKSILTGYDCIDNQVGTFMGGDYVILAGAPSMGKTLTMLNFILNMEKSGLKIDFYSLEMSLAQLQNRIICNKMMIDCDKYRTRRLNETDIKTYEYCIKEKLPKMNININPNYLITADTIRENTIKSNANIVVIDYLGLIPGTRQTSYENISENSRSLKLTALETQKPIIALHQLSRKYDERTDKTPKLSDLRDSGKIEQDADMVCFVHRPAYFDNQNSDEGELHYIVGKNRNGKSNIVIEDLRVDLAFQRITEKKCA